MSLTALPSPRYRKDVDGLRAVAILLVVAFHAVPEAFPGGFIGVDIFFVISGYLITSLILADSLHGKFCLLDFYVRRVRRIFPALLLVMGTCYFIGWHTLFADEFKELGKHLLGGATFASNLILLGETGYFDRAAALKPLLHLWSLGIEEQFYLCWPLIIAVGWRHRNQIPVALLVLGVVSFVLGLLIVENPTHWFYSPITRWWELILGAALAYAAVRHSEHIDRWEKRYGKSASYAGALFICVGVATASSTSAYLAWSMLFPTIGALLIIAAGTDAPFNRVVLSNRWMIWLGLISFPLYLWHWPLLSYARIVGGKAPSAEFAFLIVAASMALAWLTFKFVENPLRFGAHGKHKAAGLCLAMTAVGAAGYITYAHRGIAERQIYTATGALRSANNLPVGVDTSASCPFSADAHPDFLKYCSLHINPRAKIRVVLWGDSHARSWEPVFRKLATERDLNLIVISHGGCPPLIGARRPDGVGLLCKSLDGTKNVMNAVSALKPDFVFLTARWSLYAPSRIAGSTWQPTYTLLTEQPTGPASANAARQTLQKAISISIAELRTAGIDPIVIGPVPLLKGDPTRALVSELKSTAREHQLIHEAAWSALRKENGLRILDPASLLCKDECSGAIQGQPLYQDDNHLNAFGALLFEREILRFMGLP